MTHTAQESMPASPLASGHARQRLLVAVSRSAFARELYARFSRLPLLGPLIHRAAASVLAVGQRTWVRIPGGLAQGLWLAVDTRFEPQFLSGHYELQAQEILSTYLRPGDCFYDVGAHVGFLSLCAARTVGESGLVVAFEPEPENAEVLREAARRNAMPQIRVIEAAVWSSSGPIDFQRAGKASSRVDGQVGPIANWEDDNRVRIDGLSLDDFVQRSTFPLPKLLKIDVEAAESEVLKGASYLFHTHAPLLLCEIHNTSNEAAVCTWLKQRKYQVRWLGNRRPFPVHLLGFRG